MGDPTGPDYPSISNAAFRVITGDAGGVVKEVSSKLYNDFTTAAQRTLAAPTAPALPGPARAASLFMIGRGGEVFEDIAERGLWEAGQFVTQTAEALKGTLTGPKQPGLSTTEAASMFLTGRAGDVAQNIGGRALWEVGQFAKHTIESIYGTGAPTTATTTAPADTAPPKAKAPPPPGSKP